MNILTKYHADVQSFPLSSARIGMFASGRYTGFDQITAGSGDTGIPIVLVNSNASLQQTKNDNTADDHQGTVLTPHGVVISSTDTIPLNIAKNQDGWSENGPVPINGDRYDLIYLEYWWADADPGNDPFVAVIQGARGTGVPSLSMPLVQVALGVVKVPYGAGSFSELTYTPSIIPYFGGASIVANDPELDARYARLLAPNSLHGTQNTTPYNLTVSPSGNYSLHLTKANGNIFTIDCGGAIINLWELSIIGSDFVPGTRLTLYFKNVSNSSRFLMSTDGYRGGFIWNSGLVGTPYYPIRNGMCYEVELQVTPGPWRIVNAFDYLSYIVGGLRTNVDALMAGYVAPTPFRQVPESGSGYGDDFNQAFSSVGASSGERLRYRMNKGGDLEITGQFRPVVQKLHPGPVWEKVFTLLPDYNPGRTIVIEAQRVEQVTSSDANTSRRVKIDSTGAVSLSMYTADHTGWYDINVTISLALGSGGADSGNGGGSPL